MRQFNADLRRVEVGRLITKYGVGCGTRARIVRELNVHRSTITRDIQRLWAPEGEKCPTCERWMHYKKWEQLEEDQTRRPGNVLAVTRATSEVA